MGKLRAPRSARGRVMVAAGMVMVGSLGIQTSSSLSASLFGALGPIPVSSMRMLVAAIVILALTRPKLAGRSKGEWLGIVIYGLAMAAMNVCLYSAIDRIPMGVAVTLEFLGPCVVALAGSHHWREGLCAVVALVGVGLISFTPGGYFNPAGYLFALGSAVCFGLEQFGVFADVMPRTFCAAALGETIAGEAAPKSRIVLLRAKRGSEELLPPLKNAGLKVEDVPLYETICKLQETLKETIEKQQRQGEIDLVTFTSASTVRGFVQALPGIDTTKIRAVCIGEQTANEAKRYGMQIQISKEASVESMVLKILELAGD